MAAMVGVFGPASVARRVIGGNNGMHRKAEDEQPTGEAYRALDPELLDRVSATAAYGFLKAYHRFVHPLTPAKRANYYCDGDAIARLYGMENPRRAMTFSSPCTPRCSSGSRPTRSTANS